MNEKNIDPEPAVAGDDRDTTIKAIREALRARSDRAWSVRGGRGTSWGWITVVAPPARCDAYGSMSETDRVELGALLGLPDGAHHQGVLIPASSAHRREYLARAEGRTPAEIAQPYWD